MPGMALNETLHRLHPAYNTLTTLTIVLDSDTVPDLGALFRLETLTMIFPTSRTVKWTAATPPKLTTLNINATQELGLISIPPIALLASVVASIGKTTSVPMVLLGHKKLKSLYLHICIAQGTIPSALGELADLKELLIEACDDHGSALTLDFRILAALRRLEFLRLGHVKLFNLTGSGSRPLGRLSTIRISSGLAGGVGLVLGSIFLMAPNARVIFMDDNQLVGQLPENISAVSPLLAELRLPRNQINGTIPGAWFDSLPKLTIIDLSNNYLTGPLPPSLSDLELHVLRVNGNELTGEIGALIPKKLEVLALHDNHFTGFTHDFILNVLNYVPDSATWMVQLSLENNPWICTCRLYTAVENIRKYSQRLVLYDNPRCAPVNGYANEPFKTWLRPSSSSYSCIDKTIRTSLDATESQVSLSWTVKTDFFRMVPLKFWWLRTPKWIGSKCWTKAEFFSEYPKLLEREWHKHIMGILNNFNATDKPDLSYSINLFKVTLIEVGVNPSDENGHDEFYCDMSRRSWASGPLKPGSRYQMQLQEVFVTLDTVLKPVQKRFDVIFKSALFGDSTYPKVVQTKDSIPFKMTEKEVSLGSPSIYSLSIHWREPLPFQGTILRYEIIEGCDPSMERMLPPADGWERTRLLENLPPATQFCFRFRAVTSAGPGPWSKLFKTMTRRACSRGYMSVDSLGTSCKACKKNTFRDFGNRTCVSCPIDRPFTLGTGTVREGGCVAGPGYIQVGAATAGCDRISKGIICKTYGTYLESVRLKPGYWRIANTSTDIRECSPRKFCSGNISNNYCALHHTGILCRACEPGYLIYADGCRLEGDKEGFGWPLLITCCIILLLLPSCWLVWSSWKRRQGPPNLNMKFRIFFGFMQIHVLLVTQANINILTALYFPFTLDTVALFSVSPYSMQINTFAWNAILSISPIIVILVLYLTNLLILKLAKYAKPGCQWKMFWWAVLVYLYVIYPTITWRLLKSFLFDTFPRYPGDPNPYFSVLGDPLVEYGANVGWMCFTGAVIILYVIGVPFLIIHAAYIHHQGAKQRGGFLAGSFFCEPYKRRYWWFEVYELFRKLSLVLVVVLLEQSAYMLSIALFTLICVAALGIVVKLNPYESRTDCIFMEVSLSILIVQAVVTQGLEDSYGGGDLELNVALYTLLFESLTFAAFLLFESRKKTVGDGVSKREEANSFRPSREPVRCRKVKKRPASCV